MSPDENEKEKGLQIRVELDENLEEKFERIQEFLGIGNRADVIRHLIVQYHLPPPRFEHINTYDDHITVKDNVLSRNADVYLKDDGVAHCNVCNLSDCQHIDYALSLPKVLKILNAKGWKRKR